MLRISPDSGAARQNGATVTVTPSSASVRVGQLQTFAATVTGATGGVTWSVNDVPGGDGSVGTIDTSGRYLAPAAVPNPSAVTVRATSVAVPTASGSAAVTVLPLPSITSVSPSSFPAGPFTLTVNGAGFTSGAVVSFGGTPLPTTLRVVDPAHRHRNRVVAGIGARRRDDERRHGVEQRVRHRHRAGRGRHHHLAVERDGAPSGSSASSRPR